ncbi:SIS domain-containing protein [Arthrobacter sp. U41]|uniref:D-sedoheptulose-7-phosphate isomerase n=1 Tax=Arthrobacter sp. U41 TaxID=1849032 RepID=UPI0021B5BA03|nr:SIS domain-containing protein [Arthrobacter sp. U41]
MSTELPLADVPLPAPFARRSGKETGTGEGVAGWSPRDPAGAVEAHLRNFVPALESLRAQSPQLAAWGEELARRLLAGNRLLAAGNGGSAAEAQHLTAELVGRFDGERAPFSAISLHADTSAVTAIANDYGFEELYARQVRAHGRPRDILLLLSTSGKSPNLLRAAKTAARMGVTTWALTGRGPNPLSLSCDETIAVEGPAANAQECHLIAVHAICRAFDAEVDRHGLRGARQGARP